MAEARVRKPRRPEVVAARIQGLLQSVAAPDYPVGVQPLNAGYFRMEAIRMRARPRKAGSVRKPLQASR